ncbi:glycosyl hydrolase [Duganella sp. FT92W]|uniref:Glycosyl hydrolase n=2 Tax=Pseudoduganella rivuli TaxID=2666085 RepID=A0A7X2IKP3_9BURK|nr:glycosyl hydrolase [Pseudoduganella rivuli]
MTMKTLKLAALAPLLVTMLASSNAAALQPARADAHAAQAMMLDATRAGRRIVAVGEHGYVLMSDDDGATQRQARAVPADMTLTAVSFADARHGWAVGHGGVIVHTADGGETWSLQRQDAAADQPLLTVYFRDAQHGWAAGLWSLLLATSDGGKTWRQVALPPQDGGKRADLNLLKIFPSQGGQLFIAAERGMVLRSRDDGASWQYLATGSKASLWSGTAAGGHTLLVAGLGGRMLRSTDDGASWAVVDAGTAGSITQLQADAGSVWASSLDGRLLRSADDGRTWETVGAAGEPLTAIAARTGGAYLRYTRRGLAK